MSCHLYQVLRKSLAICKAQTLVQSNSSIFSSVTSSRSKRSAYRAFDEFGLKSFTNHTLSRWRGAKWVIRCYGCKEPVTPDQAIPVYLIKFVLSSKEASIGLKRKLNDQHTVEKSALTQDVSNGDIDGNHLKRTNG